MAKQRRDKGEGSIRERKNAEGRVIGYEGTVTVGIDGKGKQRRRSVSGKTKREVLDKLTALREQVRLNMVSTDTALSVGQFLDEWAVYKHGNTRPNTARSYTDTVRLHLKPELARSRLDKLTPLDVQRALKAMGDSGKSANTVKYALRVLRMALNQAVAWGYVPRNVAEVVEPPRVEKTDLTVWTAAQVVRFDSEAKGHRLGAALMLAALTGLRRGEVLGLTWTDLDIESGTLQVRQQVVEVREVPQEGRAGTGSRGRLALTLTLAPLKTAASRRVIALSPGTLRLLEDHRTRQEADRLKGGAAWQNTGLIFTMPDGRMVFPHHLGEVFRALTVKAGLPPIRLHDLRHTAASLMIQRGTSPKVVSGHLGHTNVAFTLNTYTHLYDEQRRAAALDLGDLTPRAAGLN